MNYQTLILDQFIHPKEIIPAILSELNSHPIEAIWLSEANLLSLNIATGQSLISDPSSFLNTPIHVIPSQGFQN